MVDSITLEPVTLLLDAWIRRESVLVATKRLYRLFPVCQSPKSHLRPEARSTFVRNAFHGRRRFAVDLCLPTAKAAPKKVQKICGGTSCSRGGGGRWCTHHLPACPRARVPLVPPLALLALVHWCIGAYWCMHAYWCIRAYCTFGALYHCRMVTLGRAAAGVGGEPPARHIGSVYRGDRKL